MLEFKIEGSLGLNQASLISMCMSMKLDAITDYIAVILVNITGN